MPFTLRRLTTHDARECAALGAAAFRASHALNRAMHPNGLSPSQLDEMIAQDIKAITDKPNAFLLCLYDEPRSTSTGPEHVEGETVKAEIVGGADWNLSGDHPDSDDEDEEPDGPENPEYPYNKDLEELYVKQMKEACERAMKDVKRFYHLYYVFTNPAHARRGAATQLIQWGLDRADAEGVPCYLDATPIGKALYERLGFEEMGRDEIDLRKWGVDEVNVSYAMVRLPKGKGESMVVQGIGEIEQAADTVVPV